MAGGQSHENGEHPPMSFYSYAVSQSMAKAVKRSCHLFLFKCQSGCYRILLSG